MKLNILLLVLVILIGVGSGFSQQEELSDSARTLSKRIKTEGSKAILDAGDSGDKSLIPYLKKLASDSKEPWAQIALAKLGEEKYINQILVEVDSPDELVRTNGLEKLVRVGGKVTFRKLYEMLNQLKPLPQTDNKRRYRYDRYTGAYEVFTYLNRVVEDVPKADVKGNYWTNQINLWKAWFENHKDLIE